MTTSIYCFPAFYPEEGPRNLEYCLNRLFTELYAEHPTASAIYPRVDLALTTESSSGAVGSVAANQAALEGMMNAVAASYMLTTPRIVLDSSAASTGGFTNTIASRVNDWAQSFKSQAIPAETYLLSLDFFNGVYRINS